jgi:hypothetical protein
MRSLRVADRDGRVLDDLPNPVERLDVDDFIDGGFAVDEGAHGWPLFRRESLLRGVPPTLAFGVPVAAGRIVPLQIARDAGLLRHDVSGEINDRDADRERIQYQPKKTLAFDAKLLGALSVSECPESNSSLLSTRRRHSSTERYSPAPLCAIRRAARS